MAALLTAAHSICCLAVARALHARGIPVVVVGRAGSLAFSSRAVTRGLIAPSSCNEPEAFARLVVEAARAHRVKVVMPLDDSSLVALESARPVLEKTARLALADSACLRVAMDKARLTETAARLGVPTPRSRLVTTLDEARAAAADLGYPVVVKPRSSAPHRGVPGHLRFKVRFAGGWEGLEDILGRYLTNGRSLLLQEYCPGVLACLEGFCVEGTIVAVTLKHSAKTHPLTGLMDVVRTMVPLDSELLAQARRLLEGMRFEGLFNLQFRQSPSDGAWRLIDFNPRAGIFVGTVVRTGIDTPYLAYEWYAHRRLASVGPYRPGVRGRGLWLDVRHTALVLRGIGREIDPFYPSRARAVADFLLEFFRADHYDTFALADPLPALAEPFHRALQGLKRGGRAVLRNAIQTLPIGLRERARQAWPSF